MTCLTGRNLDGSVGCSQLVAISMSDELLQGLRRALSCKACIIEYQSYCLFRLLKWPKYDIYTFGRVLKVEAEDEVDDRFEAPKILRVAQT